MRKHLWALLAVALVFIAPAAANAACPYTGNTSGTDSAAILNAMNDICGSHTASGKTPVASTFSATGQSASFTPIAGRGFNVSLWGTFSATVQLERSFDSGTTWLPLTAAGTQLYKWTAAASESAEEDETPVFYRLNCTAYTSGTVNYRVSQ